MNMLWKLSALLSFIFITICSCKKNNDSPSQLKYTSQMGGARLWSGTYNNGLVTDTAAITIINSSTIAFMHTTLTYTSTNNVNEITFSGGYGYPGDLGSCQPAYYYNTNKIAYTRTDTFIGGNNLPNYINTLLLTSN